MLPAPLHTRCTGFAAVVAIGEAPVTLLVLSALNVVGAVSMALAIRKGSASGADKAPAQGDV